MNIYYTNNISSFYKYESSMILHGFIRTFCIKNHIPKASTISCLCLKTKKKKKKLLFQSRIQNMNHRRVINHT